MTLKSACKTATILIVISAILILAGLVFRSMMFFSRIPSDQNGWSATPDGPHYIYDIIRMQLFQIIPIVLYHGLLLAGFITLLSACLKRYNDPQANVKTRYIVAAVLIGLTLIQNVFYFWMTLRHSPPLSLQLGLSLCRHLITALCLISLCIFAAADIRKIAARTPAVLALICHWLLVAVTIAGTVNTLYRGLIFNSNQPFGELFPVFWFAGAFCSHTGTFLQLAAVLIFLLAWLKATKANNIVTEPTEVLSLEPTP